MLNRITNTTLVNRNLRYINEGTQKLQKVQNQISSGKLIKTASDDPISSTRIMSLNSEVKKIVQYKKNLDDGISFLQHTSSILTQVEALILQVRDMAETAASEVVTSAEKNALAFQVNQLLEELIQFSNTKFEGKFIFGGTETLSGAKPNALPFNMVLSGNILSRVIPNPEGINGKSKRIVGEGKTIEVNLAGDDIFQPNGSGGMDDVFGTLIKLRENLQANDTLAIRQRMSEIDSEYDQITSQNTLAGAKIDRMELIKGQLDELKLVQKEHLSSVEDTDIAEAIIRLNTEEISFKAALQTSAKILSQSLLDYI